VVWRAGRDLERHLGANARIGCVEGAPRRHVCANRRRDRLDALGELARPVAFILRRGG
jgi:hypothetical protein